MWPKAISGLAALTAPTVDTVIPSGTNPDMVVGYTIGVVQSFAEITVEFLLNGSVDKTITIGPFGAPVDYGSASTTMVSAYTEGAEISIRLTSQGQTVTSAVHTTGYAVFTPGLELSGMSGSFVNNTTYNTPTYGFTCPFLTTDNYYDAYLELVYEWGGSPAIGYSYSDTETIALPSTGGASNVGDSGMNLTPVVGGAQQGIIAVRYRIQGYSGIWLTSSQYIF